MELLSLAPPLRRWYTEAMKRRAAQKRNPEPTRKPKPLPNKAFVHYSVHQAAEYFKRVRAA